MRDQRSASQILFGLLPQQTVDLQGRVWRVKEWIHPVRELVDDDTMRRELCRLASPWQASNLDGGFVANLRAGHEVKVFSLNRDNGVRVEPFPNTWMCRACRRLRSTPDRCKCGQSKFGQLPFVGYHPECGIVREPYIKPCPNHDDVRVDLPGTASASEIEFRCPTCEALLRKGFGFPKCQCGAGSLTFNVHRASSVYTPRTIVMVNPPSPQRVRRLAEVGGASRALSWVLGGLSSASVEDVGLTRDNLLRQLLASGIERKVAETMVAAADAGGQLSEDDSASDIPHDRREAAAAEATTVAYALFDSRTRISDLVANTPPAKELGKLYRSAYPEALALAGLEGIDLVDQFPVLTGNFGFTRGSSTPGASQLVPFRERNGAYVVYGEVGNTEALFIRLRPTRVASWLERCGFSLGGWSDDRSARVAILKAADIPLPGAQATTQTVGTELLRLVHSLSHRFIRRTAVMAGIEQTSLSELLVPRHLGFFIYAAARGDFVLGGLQAVFETELHSLLRAVALGEQRCPLDPGCTRAGGACVACLHLGEPSCRYFNGYLDRRVISGTNGFLDGPEQILLPAGTQSAEPARKST